MNIATKEDLRNKLKKIMSDLFRVDIASITEESSMKTLPRWDSLKHMQLIVVIEGEFDIGQLQIEEIIQMTKFASIISILAAKLEIE